MPGSILQKLYEKNYWTDVYQFFENRSFRQDQKLASYQEIIEKNQYSAIASRVISKNYRFKPPLRLVVNKLQSGKKKTVYLFDYQDDFLLKVINRLLTDSFSYLISPSCHSFQKGKGAKTAFRSLVSDPFIDSKYCLKTDIRNFFNSVNVNDFIENLPKEIISDQILYELIKQILLNNNARLPDGRIITEQKGLMAGCPLAPFLSNIYLRSLDDIFTKQNITYTRYSDDIVLFDHECKIEEHRKTIETFLANKNLFLNKEKTSITIPGEMAIFLGFSYSKGVIDLSPVSVNKMKGKIKRMARSYNRRLKRGKMDDTGILRHFISRINRKMYGIDAQENNLCWAHWFFPVINTHKSLEILDRYIQERLRFSITGKNNKHNFGRVPYKTLKSLSYKPLKATFYVFKSNYHKYMQILQSDYKLLNTNE